MVLEEISVNLLEQVTNRYVGNLCRFKKCPAAKRACEVPGCGAIGHLQQISGYRLSQDDLQSDRGVRLFDRATATVKQAIDLPGPPEAESADSA